MIDRWGIKLLLWFLAIALLGYVVSSVATRGERRHTRPLRMSQLVASSSNFTHTSSIFTATQTNTPPATRSHTPLASPSPTHTLGFEEDTCFRTYRKWVVIEFNYCRDTKISDCWGCKDRAIERSSNFCNAECGEALCLAAMTLGLGDIEENCSDPN